MNSKQLPVNGISSDVSKIKSEMAHLLPDEEARRLCLSLFLESLMEADTKGSNKWGVYYARDVDRLRLLVGSLIVLAIHKQGLWMTLDQELLEELPWDVDRLAKSSAWQWDPGRWSYYTLVPSKNGYYTPGKDHLQIWPVLRQFHFEYIDKVARKYSQLRADSQRKHMPQTLAYLRQELGRYVPKPVYDDSSLLLSNPIQEIREYESDPQNQNLQATEREAIIQSRLGQGRFRTKLISYWGGCAVTNCQAREILRASHIKPWSRSSNAERLDVYNGFLLIPNLDVAFDSGLITFADDGMIIISDSLAASDRVKLGVCADMKIQELSQEHLKYLQYHRENVFKKNSFTSSVME